MWDGEWDFGPSDGDNFDLVHPLYRFTQRVLETRARHEALRRGTMTERIADASPGLYAYERRSAGDTALVVVNNSNGPLTRSLGGAPWPPGTPLADALDAAAAAAVDGAGALALEIPARGVRVYESAAAAAAAPPRLHVESCFPGHDQRLNDDDMALGIVFDRDVSPDAVAAAFAITPPVAGVWQVLGREARFHPLASWSATDYRWSLAAGLAATDGAQLAGRFEATFHVPGVASGITVPAGYAADRIARQGFQAPEAIVPAPWIAPQTLLVSDTGRDRVFTITPGGDLGHWLGDARWSRALGVCAGAATTIVDAAGVFEADARRLVTLRVGGSGITATGAVAAGTPAYGSLLHLSEPANDRVRQLTAANTYQTLATGLGGAEGLAFGPGGAWGSELYVADANLGAVATSVNGQGRIARVSPAGVVTTVVQNGALLNGVIALAFDVEGRFGGHLFGADILNERIVQITAGGAVSVFATGFKNLSGPSCLAFGPDGALYVADAGSGQPFSNTNGTNPPQVVRIARAERVTGVDEPAAALAFAAPAPNPARGAVRLAFQLAREGDATLELFDVGGRRVRSLARGRMAAGAHAVLWDGRDERGAESPAGLYLARLVSGGAARVQRIVRLP